MHIINIFFLVYSGSTFFVNARLLTIEDHSTTFGESTFLDCQLQSITVNVTHFCLYQTKTLHASGCLKRMKREREREREGGGWGGGGVVDGLETTTCLGTTHCNVCSLFNDSTIHLQRVNSLILGFMTAICN